MPKVNHRGDREPPKRRQFKAEQDAASGVTPWRDHALNMARNGFSPVPVEPRRKKPRFDRWTAACGGRPDLTFIRRHAATHPADSVGAACGVLRDPAGESLGRQIVVDIDADTWTEADGIEDLAFHHLGQTRFVRSRLGSPRRALLYRIDGRVKSKRLDGCEILGEDHQLVGFGLHPSGSAYAWRDASPADTPAAEVPLVSRASLDAFLAAAGAKPPAARPFRPAALRKGLSASANVLATITAGQAGSLGWKTVDGLVIDGRESFLTWCVGKAAGDARRAWSIFEQHSDQSRPKGSDPSAWWTLADAETKAHAWRRKVAQREAGTRSVGRPRAAHRALLSANQRRAHAAAVDRAHQHGRIGPAAVVVSAIMLDFAAGHLGMCKASLETIGRSAGRSRSTVANARAELIGAGLWAHEAAGVYAPIVSGEFFEPQPVEQAQKSGDAVQSPVGPKGTVGVSQPLPAIPPAASEQIDGVGDPKTISRIMAITAWPSEVASALARMRPQVTPVFSIPWRSELRPRRPADSLAER